MNDQAQPSDFALPNIAEQTRGDYLELIDDDRRTISLPVRMLVMILAGPVATFALIHLGVR